MESCAAASRSKSATPSLAPQDDCRLSTRAAGSCLRSHTSLRELQADGPASTICSVLPRPTKRRFRSPGRATLTTVIF